jgi:hypothetical protein
MRLPDRHVGGADGGPAAALRVRAGLRLRGRRTGLCLRLVVAIQPQSRGQIG